LHDEGRVPDRDRDRCRQRSALPPIVDSTKRADVSNRRMSGTALKWERCAHPKALILHHATEHHTPFEGLPYCRSATQVTTPPQFRLTSGRRNRRRHNDLRYVASGG